MMYELIFIIGCLIIKLYITIKEKNLYYSNYKNCLMALEEYDPKLKEYLERKNK